MRKHLFMVLCLMIFIISECIHPEMMSDSAVVSAVDKQTLKSRNGWFFESDDAYLSAEVTVNCIIDYESSNSSKPIRSQQLNASVCKVLDMQNGSVYKIVIEPIENHDGYLNEARLNLYFYVTSEEIYRIWSYVYEDNTLKEFYDDDQLLIEILNTEEKIINNSYLVCQQIDLSDSLERGEIGMHNCVEIKENQVDSSMWNVTENGETYFYENFTWELGKGLISYRSGFGAEGDILYLDNISIIN